MKSCAGCCRVRGSPLICTFGWSKGKSKASRSRRGMASSGRIITSLCVSFAQCSFCGMGVFLLV